jgi:hypothetical protein
MQKMIPVKTVTVIRRRGMENSGGNEFKYDIFDTL